MDDDNWVNLAMSNELLVANLLLQLKHDTLHSPSLPPLPPRCSTKRASPILNCWWSVHRARSTKRHSKSPTKRLFESPKRQAATTARKKGEPELKPKPEPFSPDTPFSWNGSMCTGGTVAATDGHNNNPLDSARPKVGDQSDQTATTKGSRRKRTSAEVTEEESLLLKNGTDLKNQELGSSHHTVEKNGVTKESSKRKLTLKINLASRKIVTTGTSSMVSGNDVCDQSQLAEAHCHPSESVTPQTVQANKVLDDVANSASKQQEIRNQDPLFLLPDLNMSLGEDFNSQD